MRLQLISLAILTFADITFVRFLTGVCVNVIREFRLHAEAQLAKIALKSFYAGMPISVHLQTPRSPVVLAAIFTFIGPDTYKSNSYFIEVVNLFLLCRIRKKNIKYYK